MLTTHETAERLGIKPRSVVALIRRGRLTAEKRGRDWFIEAGEVERYKSERLPAHRPKHTHNHTAASDRDDTGGDTASAEGVGER